MGTIKRGFANNILTTGKFDATDLSGTIPSSNVANTTLSSVTSVPASVGDLVQTTATDPSPVTAGDVWYNTTSRTLKAAVLQAAAWASGGNVGSSFYSGATGGTQTAAYKAGGGFPRNSTASESYNGTSWTTAGSLNTARSRLSAGVVGIQTAGLGTGGYNTSLESATEHFNGSSWTSATSMPAGRQSAGASGLQTAALVFGGGPSPTSSISYNGSSWTSTPSMITGGSLTGVGTQTATLAVGTVTESWNGTSWTSGTTMNSPRSQIMLGGTQTLALGSGGYSGPPATALSTVEKWNGTSWTTDASLNTARRIGGSHGTSVGNSMVSSGINSAGSQITSTEEYVDISAVAKTVTTS
jgi:hypothetical protein